jgi:hypothetical protein
VFEAKQEMTVWQRKFFSHENIFHLEGKSNHHTFGVCGCQNPQQTIEQEGNTPNTKTLCDFHNQKFKVLSITLMPIS